MDDKILDYGDVLLRRQDALLLLGPHWLNDQVIGFYFEYLQHEACAHTPGLLFLPGSATYLLACLGANGGGPAVVLEPHGFPGAVQLALFAVNNNPDCTEAEGGSHWSLLTWSAADGTFRHYDSMAGSNAGAARQVRDAAAAALPDGGRGGSAPLLQQRCPQQRNAYDCGMYVLAVARLLCRRYAADGEGMSFEVAADEIRPADVTDLREEVYAIIAGKAAAAGTARGLPPIKNG